jgi:hypothetical protein
MRSALQSHFCMFIGLSGEDQLFDSLLVTAHSGHPCLAEGLPFLGAWLAEAPNKLLTGQWEARGVCVHNIHNYKSGLAEFLFAVCRRAATRRLTID